MKVIDLRNYQGREGDWVVDYLAWQASIVPNWIECELELLGYPTADMTVWWTIICLDGAPERMSHHMKRCQGSYSAARDAVSPEEDHFRFLIKTQVLCLSAEPVVRVAGNWRDGMIIGYTTRELACDLVARVANACFVTNYAELLLWNQEYHVRAGVGLSMRAAFSVLLSAQRDQLRCHNRTDTGSLRDNFTDVIALAPLHV